MACLVAGTDVFVFPGKTDTFGLVMLEAMACGVPVAAYPVTGPIDIMRPGVTGRLHEDLLVACAVALELNRNDCRQYAEQRKWRWATHQFVSSLAPRTPQPAMPRLASASVAPSIAPAKTSDG